MSGTGIARRATSTNLNQQLPFPFRLPVTFRWIFENSSQKGTPLPQPLGSAVVRGRRNLNSRKSKAVFLSTVTVAETERSERSTAGSYWYYLRSRVGTAWHRAVMSATAALVA
eukprot:3530542-Rhodomonas_salina.1